MGRTSLEERPRTTSTPLRVLLVEDSRTDAGRLLSELERAGYDVTHERVQTAATMDAALRRAGWDLIEVGR
ncbi:MAG: hypothetical protein ABJA98_20325 [Acidobacteriota bacterium]